MIISCISYSHAPIGRPAVAHYPHVGVVVLAVADDGHGVQRLATRAREHAAVVVDEARLLRAVDLYHASSRCHRRFCQKYNHHHQFLAFLSIDLDACLDYSPVFGHCSPHQLLALFGHDDHAGRLDVAVVCSTTALLSIKTPKESSNV